MEQKKRELHELPNTEIVKIRDYYIHSPRVFLKCCWSKRVGHANSLKGVRYSGVKKGILYSSYTGVLGGGW